MCFVLLKYLDEELFRFSGGGGDPPQPHGGVPLCRMGGPPFFILGKLKSTKKPLIYI